MAKHRKRALLVFVSSALVLPGCAFITTVVDIYKLEAS